MMGREHTWSHGRSWEVAKAGKFFMTCFDAFGNRGHYDYFVWNKDGMVAEYKKVDKAVAIQKFKTLLKEKGEKYEEPTT